MWSRAACLEETCETENTTRTDQIYMIFDFFQALMLFPITLSYSLSENKEKTVKQVFPIF